MLKLTSWINRACMNIHGNSDKGKTERQIRLAMV